MIPIQLQPEPPTFFELVQKRGDLFLKENPHPKNWRNKEYWRHIIPHLYEAYSGICAYTCHWIPLDTGFRTVDHFKPKTKYPQHAYRWDNYRLICGTMNGRKGDAEDVLDPFTLPNGWFHLHLTSLQLIPCKSLSIPQKKKVEQTIKRLKLNDYACISGRKDWLLPYLQEEYKLPHLQKRAPFIAQELIRQGVQDIHHPIWSDFRSPPRLA